MNQQLASLEPGTDEHSRVSELIDGVEDSDFALFVHLHDENGDGVHDDAKDRDIDGDGVPNLIDGQGTWAGRSMTAKFDAEEQDAINLYVEELKETKCSETYKKSSLEYAAKDCRNAKIEQLKTNNTSAVLRWDSYPQPTGLVDQLRSAYQP